MAGRHVVQEEQNCPYDGCLMTRAADGIECSECGHRLWDMHENISGASLPTSRTCPCIGCAAIRGL